MFSHIKSILLPLLLLGLSITGFAKNNVHRFEVKTSTYTELTGDIDVTQIAYDSGYALLGEFAGQPFAIMGRTWNFDGNGALLALTPTGRVMFVGDTLFALADIVYSDSIDRIDASSKVSYKIEGAGNNKILKLQWKNMRVHFGPAGNYFNAQIWIYQQSGVIEYRFGPRSANNASGYTDPKKGIYTGLWLSQNPDLTRVYEKMQITGTPPAINVDSARNTNVPNVQGIPEEGTMYRFTPKVAVSGIKETPAGLDFNVYPNPATDKLVLDVPEHASVLTARMYDMKGICVHVADVPISTSRVLIDVSRMKNGIYLITLGDAYKVSTQCVVIGRE